MAHKSLLAVRLTRCCSGSVLQSRMSKTVRGHFLSFGLVTQLVIPLTVIGRTEVTNCNVARGIWGAEPHRLLRLSLAAARAKRLALRYGNPFPQRIKYPFVRILSAFTTLVCIS